MTAVERNGRAKRHMFHVALAALCVVHVSLSQSFPESPIDTSYSASPLRMPPYYVQPEMRPLLAGVALAIVAAYADYQIQAEAHGWSGLLWERNKRAKKWTPALDWIPHDEYHITMFIRNLAMLALPTVVYFMTEDWAWYWRVAAVIGCYTAGRAIGFSVPRQINIGY